MLLGLKWDFDTWLLSDETTFSICIERKDKNRTNDLYQVTQEKLSAAFYSIDL